MYFILLHTQAVSRRRIHKKSEFKKQENTLLTYKTQKQSSFKQVIQLAVNVVHCTSIHLYYIYLFLSVSTQCTTRMCKVRIY